MRKLDLIVGIVGGVVLIAALAGAYREGATGLSTPGRYEIAWKTQQTDLGTQTQIEGSTFKVSVNNLTAVSFAVTLRAGTGFLSPNGDPVEVTVEPPAGSGLNVTAAAATLSTANPTVTIPVDVRVGGIPSVGAAEGPTDKQALANLAKGQTSTRGTGEWTVTVKITRTLAQAGTVTGEIKGTATSYVAAVKAPDSPTRVK